MNGTLLYCGITQDRVPVGIRERVQADAARRRELARSAAPLADGLLVLSTCERFELYADARMVDPLHWTALLAGAFDFSTDALAPHLHFRTAGPAAQHLLRVAAGLESRLLGEPHILRQVRAAYLDGLEHRELGATLSALGRAALHVGKRVRRETTLPAAGDSIMSLALARMREGDAVTAHARRVVVLGTGMLAREALSRLARWADTQVTVVSRVAARAVALAERFGARAADLSALKSLLRQADALLACSTAADGFLVQRRCVRGRRGRPLQIVDLGLPRNVDPDVASLPGVELVQLERLHSFSAACPAAVAAAESIVARELQRFGEWQRARTHAGAIAGWLASSAAQGPPDRSAIHARIARLKAQVAA